MILSSKSTCFHRNLCVAALDNKLATAWLEWEYPDQVGVVSRHGTEGTIGQGPVLTYETPFPTMIPGRLGILPYEEDQHVILATMYLDHHGFLCVTDSADRNLSTVDELETLNFHNFAAVHEPTTCLVHILAEIWTRTRKQLHHIILNRDLSVRQCASVESESAFLSRPFLCRAGDNQILAVWDEYHGRSYQTASALLSTGDPVFLPKCSVSDHWCSLPSACVDGRGRFYQTFCAERLVHAGNKHVNHHSRLVTMKLDDNQEWEQIHETGIDHAMNPWLAAYAGLRRFSNMLASGDQVHLLFEEKNDPYAMDPSYGRLVSVELETGSESVILENCNGFVPANGVLSDSGKLAVATKTQQEAYQQRLPYVLHFCDLQKAGTPRPESVFTHAADASFTPKPTVRALQAEDRGLRLWFGDPHVHSSLSMDLDGEQDELYHFARDVATLDFVAFTENDITRFTEPLAPDQWELSLQNARFFNANGPMTTFVGWEFTPHTIPGIENTANSHRSVLTDQEDLPIFSCFEQRTPLPPDLIKKLLQGDRCLVNLHHSSGSDLTDNNLERNIELVSGWSAGMCESADFRANIHRLLNSGWKLGFIGASDNHERNPGLGGGLTGVWAEENSRSAIFEAMQKRHCFATTGLRPDLRFNIGDAMMGDEITIGRPPELRVHVSCSEKIRLIELIKNGQTIFSRNYDDNTVGLHYVDDNPESHKEHNWYYAHIILAGQQQRLHWNLAPPYGIHAWTSPIWIDIC